MKKYSTTFSRLMSLILNMSEKERAILLKQSQQLIDNRKTYRTPCLIPAHYNILDSSYMSYILNINDHGAFIETDERFAIGQDIKLKYFDPFCRIPLKFKGKIVWSSFDGIGVKFKYLLDSPF